MTLNSDIKFEEESTCCCKNGMRNLVNLHASTSPQICILIGYLRPKCLKNELQITEE